LFAVWNAIAAEPARSRRPCKNPQARSAAFGEDRAAMNWDDLRYVLALADAGSLAKAARALKVDHTTVGRRVEALEADLGLRLFTRTTSGYVLTQEAERILPELREVEAAVLQLERCAASGKTSLEGSVRITSAETFGSTYLAPRLARFGRANPALTIELMIGSAIFDLARREADVAVRFFRSEHEHLAVSKAGEVAYALYATEEYLAPRGAPRGPHDLANHEVLCAPNTPTSDDVDWVRGLCPDVRFTFVSNLTLAILHATLAGAGLGLLPRYLGDVDPRLRRVPMPDEPRQTIWLTVHKDLRHTRRVRQVLDFLRAEIEKDRVLLSGSATG
jgi:DNA-binding transcriptional LysR family regulator